MEMEERMQKERMEMEEREKEKERQIQIEMEKLNLIEIKNERIRNAKHDSKTATFRLWRSFSCYQTHQISSSVSRKRG